MKSLNINGMCFVMWDQSEDIIYYVTHTTY